MNPTPLSFNVQNNHPLIPREQTYTLDRKLVTIHSEDRDTCKWPNANEFEIELPETMQNVQSIRLAETAMPSNFYNISRQFQNTALPYKIKKLFGLEDKEETLELCDGFYTPIQLACVLTKLFKDILVKYDPILQKFVFFSKHEFTFNFDKRTCLAPTCDNSKEAWCNSTKWGLGYFIGFDKKEYNSVEVTHLNIGQKHHTCNITNCLYQLINAPQKTNAEHKCEADLIDYHKLSNEYKHILLSPNFPKLEGEQVIYMEVEKYNSYDEVCPFPSQTNSVFSNTYCGRVNSAFAKIPLLNGPSPDGSKTFFDSRNDSFLNISYHEPPIEKIKKLKFKFRYHNGQLVDFQNSPFTFTIEFNSLRNDIEKKYNVRMPHVFM